MGRKKKNSNFEELTKETKPSLKNETVSWVAAIGLFVVSLFFILASLGKAGFVGQKSYFLLNKLFGIGYFLIPLALMFLAIAYIKSAVKPLSKAQILGAVLFFISSLALIGLPDENLGGIVGSAISTPLLKLFEIYATSIILVAFVIISMLFIFDTAISFKAILGTIKKEEELNKEEAELKIAGIGESPSAIKNLDKVDKETKTKNEGQSKLNKESDFGDFKLNRKSAYLSQAFTPPPLSLLEKDRGKPEVGDVKANANIIKRTLGNFGIIVDMDEVSIGPSVTRYALKPAEGVKLSKILGLQNNLELALAAHPVRIEAPIPGKSLVGIEIPNSTKTTVGLGTVLSESEYQESGKELLMALGKSITGRSYFSNLAKMPHLLIAGATGSGKSVTIHVLINSLLFRNHPDHIKFIMIDPKRVELTLYNKIPHLLTPVITDAKKAIMSLKWAAKEMDRRYNILESNKVRDIESYHKNVLEPTLGKSPKNEDANIETMPYIVIIIDELADIMQAYPRELEAAIVRLAQMSRAVGIHLILSTQRPSVNIITGLIKANIPSRVALQVASQIDSRTILDSAGAEKLLGAGDMLYLSGDMSKPVRLQSPYISENEVKRVVQYLSKSYEDSLNTNIDFEADKSSTAIFDSMIGEGDDEDEDDLYAEAKETVIAAGKASTSFLQRKLRIGYARAARLIDILENKGIVSPGEGAKPRDVLVKPDGLETSYNKENNEEDEI